MDNVEVYTLDQLKAEMARQRTAFRFAYLLRWLTGWTGIAYLLDRKKAGWYLVRTNWLTKVGYTVGPFSTKAQARARGYAIPDAPSRYVVLLWEEPAANAMAGEYGSIRRWYQFPRP